jgi:hypothetical protein
MLTRDRSNLHKKLFSCESKKTHSMTAFTPTQSSSTNPAVSGPSQTADESINLPSLEQMLDLLTSLQEDTKEHGKSIRSMETEGNRVAISHLDMLAQYPILADGIKDLINEEVWQKKLKEAEVCAWKSNPC